MSAVTALLNIVLITVILTAAGVIVWRLISARHVPISMYLFFILPIGQFLMLYSISFDRWSVSWLVGVLFSLAANALLLIFTISQEKNTAAVEELEEIQHRINLEKSHYEAAQQRMEELEMIRKDFNEKLETVASLTRTGENKAARENIAALAEKINRTKENPYCNVPVINAVLTEKENDCEAAGVTLSIDLKLPEKLAVEPMHLCSIFSNILDNAITACRKITGSDKPIIRLSSVVDGDYLVIKAVNPSEAPEKAAPGRGYGTRILKGLAAIYDGDFMSDFRDGEYSVLLSLIASEREGE